MSRSSDSLRKKAIERCSSNSSSSVEMSLSVSNSSDGEGISKGEWVALTLGNHPDVLELLERLRPLSEKQTFGMHYSSAKSSSLHVINHTNVSQLIIKYLKSEGLGEIADTFSQESGIKLEEELVLLEDDVLSHLLACGISDVNTILDPAALDSELDSEVVKAVYDYDPPTIARDESDLVDDSNIWDEGPDTDDNILVVSSEADPKALTIKYATFNKIIEFLTSEAPKDLIIRTTFLDTYLSYRTPDQLLDKLIERYNVPDNSSVSEKDGKQIKVRVVLIIKSWLESNSSDFSDNLLAKLRGFIETMDNEKLAKSLRTAQAKQGKAHYHQTSDFKDCPDPKVPKNIFSVSLKLGDVPTEEVARQLTLIDYGLLAQISLPELITKQWLHEERRIPSVLLITRFNNVVKWVITSILNLSTYKERAQRIEWFIDIADHLITLHNFNTSMGIYFSISHGSVARLSHTLSALSSNARRKWKNLCTVLDPISSFAAYRVAFSGCKPPRIPFLGAHLQELIHIDASHPDRVRDMINFEKRYLQHKAVSDVVRYSTISYHFLPVHQVQEFLRRPTGMDENAMYKQSLRIEPKGITASELVAQEKVLASNT